MVFKKHCQLGEKDILKEKFTQKWKCSDSLPHETFVELHGRTAEVDGDKWNK